MNHTLSRFRAASLGLALSRFRAASLGLALTAAAALPAWASNNHGSHGAHANPATQMASSDMTEGEIRKVDKDAKKLTIRHGEIKHLDMPPMTMVFQVRDAAVLDKVKVGEKVRFVVQKSEVGFVVSDVQVVK